MRKTTGMTAHTTNNRNNDSLREEFRSGYSIVLIAIVLTPITFLTYFLVQTSNYILLVPLLILLFVTGIVAGIRYVIVENRLVFKTWYFYNGEVNISSIEKIERSYLALSSNAGSLKRLVCKLKKGSKYPFLLISPKNEELFLQKLKSINPNILINVENKQGVLRFWDWNI